jgi:hypothetical protein
MLLLPRLLFAALLTALLMVGPSFAQEVPHRTLEMSWTMTLPDDSPGYSVAILPSANYVMPTVADPVELNVPGVFALGIDTQNPPTRNPFNADGNIHNRPEREISLHWNGVEVANRFCPADLKGQKGHAIQVRVEHVVGGATVTVVVGKTTVYDHYFIPELRLPTRIAYSTGKVPLENVKLKWVGPALTPNLPPIRISAFDKVLNDKEHHRQTAEVAFPDTTKGIGRVICTLTLAETPKGIDPWDRIAQLYLYDEKGERFEILRYITPYRKGWTWKADVTDLMSLLIGKKKLEVFCETYSEGWLVSVDFDFYKGPLDKVPYKVVNLWNVTAEIGQADKPFEKAVPAKSVPIDKDAKQVKARFCVTGHGQAPNTDNAAEFIKLWRQFYVGEKKYENTLWKDDNYLNPCRPQGGTWKYDRAGWAPGDIVAPWFVDITRDVKRGEAAMFRYEIQPFVNKTPDKGNPARHLIESQIIFYRDGAKG